MRDDDDDFIEEYMFYKYIMDGEQGSGDGKGSGGGCFSWIILIIVVIAVVSYLGSCTGCS